MHKIILQISSLTLAVCQLPADASVPIWAQRSPNGFLSITHTNEELSIVCEQSLVPDNVKAQKDWRMFKIKGQLDFALVGILTRVIVPLADHGISVYTLSTYDTDFILIPAEKFKQAIAVLKKDFEIENK